MALSHQMKHRDRDMVPLFLVRAMFGLMAATLLLVAYAQWGGVAPRGTVKDFSVVNETSIILQSSREGVATVLDMDGTPLASSADEKMGFIGVVGIVVRRQRELARVANDAPLLIQQRESGTYAISDPLTGWSMELIGYGADNVAAFAALLD